MEDLDYMFSVSAYILWQITVPKSNPLSIQGGEKIVG